MTEVYLGKPPAYIETWMKENLQTEKWVPAVYMDQWIYSKTFEDQSEMIYILGPSGGYPINQISKNEYEEMMKSTDGMSTIQPFGYSVGEYTALNIKFNSYEELKSSTFFSFNAQDNSKKPLNVYRIFTPGHWEDADGKWINGSWGNWSIIQTEYQDMVSLPYHGMPGDPDGEGGTLSKEAWIFNSLQYVFPEYENANMLGVGSSNQTFPNPVRTWTNNKPAPAV